MDSSSGVGDLIGSYTNSQKEGFISPMVYTTDCRSFVTRKVLPRSHEPIRFACDDA